MKHTLTIALSLFAACGVADAQGFVWKDVEGEHPVLTFNGKTVIEYVRPTFDPKLSEGKKDGALTNPTIKVFHHLYDESGTVRLTNGPEGQYPHHRGIFFGFNKISYGDQQADVWHCRNGESQRHVELVTFKADTRMGGHKVKLTWNGRDGKVIANEVRELTVLAAKGGRLIDFVSTVTTERDKVRLDGDPQHAGFHFRANAAVEKTKGETYFLSPDGKGEKGKEANWTPKGGPTNRAWTAMSFVIGDKRYTVLYIDHADNPKEARQSERAYGRVGTYFEYDLSKDKPLKVKYRLWVQEGEATPELCKRISEEFGREK